jgi:hypothetical protein
MVLARIALLGVVMSVATVLGSPGGDAAPSSDGWGQVVSTDSTFRAQADVALTEWALGRFEEAGLTLPDLTLNFHDEKSRCRGHQGYFEPGSPHRIDICGFNWNRFLVTPRKVMLHELAHAWVHDNLDPRARDEFLELRGLDSWSSSHAIWAEQGMEHAAEIMAWGLMDEEISMTSVGGADPQNLGAAFRLLTGSGPLS